MKVFAFPLLDSGGDSSITGSRDLTSGETSDLLHQLQLVNGFSAPAGGGWTFIPRFDLQEGVTDNAYQIHAPRRSDLISFLSPGFSVAADLPRLNLTMSYSPTLAIYARDSNLNALTQQLNAVGELTVVPELAFVDVRALSGVSNLFGGFGNQGALGAQAGVLGNSTAAIVNSQGLNRQNETQNASFGFTPYLRRTFGDWGVGKAGYTFDVLRSNTLTGFASLPFPAGGQNGQTLVSNEEFATFTTGEALERLQDSISIDLTQTRVSTEAGYVNGFTGLPSTQSSQTNSQRSIFSNQVVYQVNRTLSVFVTGGYESIDYSGLNQQRINDAIWRFGTTVTPGPYSQLTVSYGHDNGFNSFAADGRYILTGRTVVTLSYNSTLGTQLQYVQRELNLEAPTPTGQVVNGVNGAPLFVAGNALAQQDTLFRTDALVLGTTTAWDRDIVSVSLALTHQTTTGTGSNGVSTSGKTVSVGWVHEMRPAMTLSGNVSFNLQNQDSGSSVYLGNYQTYAATVGWQYQLSDTVGVNLRYSLFDRISQVSTFNVYQNLLLAGLSKTF